MTAAKVGLPAAIPELDAVEVEAESATEPYPDDASHDSLSTAGEYSTLRGGERLPVEL